MPGKKIHLQKFRNKAYCPATFEPRQIGHGRLTKDKSKVTCTRCLYYHSRRQRK